MGRIWNRSHSCRLSACSETTVRVVSLSHFFPQEHRSTFGFEPIREKIGWFKPPNHHHHHHWQIWLEATFIGFPHPRMATGETGRDIFMCCCVGLMVLLAMACLSDPAPHTWEATMLSTYEPGGSLPSLRKMPAKKTLSRSSDLQRKQ